jgi:exoribonuclease R
MKLEDQSKQKINKFFRDRDESHLWPICNKFNVTERAIRNIQRSGAEYMYGLRYCEALEAEISRIVNAEV